MEMYYIDLSTKEVLTACHLFWCFINDNHQDIKKQFMEQEHALELDQDIRLRMHTVRSPRCLTLHGRYTVLPEATVMFLEVVSSNTGSGRCLSGKR